MEMSGTVRKLSGHRKKPREEGEHRGSVKQEAVMAALNAMPLSREQKAQIFYLQNTRLHKKYRCGSLSAVQRYFFVVENQGLEPRTSCV